MSLVKVRYHEPLFGCYAAHSMSKYGTSASLWTYLAVVVRILHHKI